MFSSTKQGMGAITRHGLYEGLHDVQLFQPISRINSKAKSKTTRRIETKAKRQQTRLWWDRLMEAA